jgi:hypothetical protein
MKVSYRMSVFLINHLTTLYQVTDLVGPLAAGVIVDTTPG